jgi:predicted AAA+ superfamily ATPase
MTLKPWRELAQPHKDVLEGTFKQSEFAADLTQVHNGTSSDEYKNPEKFFRRTYITEGMRLLLDSVARRISGKGGDPVIQLQTSFGGGKTHTLLAVYHLARRQVSPDQMQGIGKILSDANITDLPSAKVAIIDGNELSPSTPRVRGGVSIKTICGEIAWQLLGEPGFQMVADADRDGTSPGKDVITQLLKKAAPCVILLDELVAFIRQLETGKSYSAGTFDSNLSFIQALTESIKAVPNALLLASLPESEIEAAGPMGKLALETLEKYFARVENVWKPVATEEAFEIVKRRLFETTGNKAEVETVCNAFFNYYIENNNKFPTDTQSSRYKERMLLSYPIHPEVFDRLYEDWSTLEKFQRTRGVLQYLAIVIHKLWNSDNRDSMIMPGSLPLDDVNVRTKSIHYLPQGWEPVIESEIDGVRSAAFEIDGKETRLGAIHAARRVARTIFLGSAPSSSSQGARGITPDRILLGAAQPGQVIATYEDAVKRLRGTLHYLFGDETRSWFDTRPNLRREMESRKTRLEGREHTVPCLRETLTTELRGSSLFSGVHVFATSGDVPDEIGTGPRLVVLEPETSFAFSKANAVVAQESATKILLNRGEQPRQRRNRLVFLAPDYDSLGRLKDHVRTYLAWKSIDSEIDDGRLNADTHMKREAKQSYDQAAKVLKQSVRDCYKWLLNPCEEQVGTKFNLIWESAPVGYGTSNCIVSIENKLKEEEWIIPKWSPIHLARILKQWYFKDGTSEVVTKRVLNDFASYLYLPRLVTETVLTDAIQEGIMSEDFFGYARGLEAGRYQGLLFGTPGSVTIDESSVLIEKEKALEQKQKDNLARTLSQSSPSTGGEIRTYSSGTGTVSASMGSPAEQVTQATGSKKRFFATKDLNAQRARLDFNEVLDEVLMKLTARHTTSVSVSVEIVAHDTAGFEPNVRETIKAACNKLSFKQSDFADD